MGIIRRIFAALTSWLFVAFVLNGCANVSIVERQPSSERPPETLDDQYFKYLQNERRHDLLPPEQKKADVLATNAFKNSILKDLATRSAEFLPEGSAEPKAAYGHIHRPWRLQNEEIIFRDLEPYAVRDEAPPRFFMMSRKNAASYQVHFINTHFSHDLSYLSKRSVFPNSENRSANRDNSEGSSLHFEITCDGDFKIKKANSIQGKAGQATQFDLFDESLNGERTWFVPGADLKSCDAQFYDPQWPQQKYAIRLLNEEEVHPTTANHHQLFEACFMPAGQKLSPIEKIFLTTDFDSMTCPRAIEKLEPLEDPIDGFQVKVAALLGQPLSEAFLAKKDPFLPLDFSRAPHFDEIEVAYLVIRNDYYGTILKRLLEYHAAKGATVRVLVSKNISLAKDIISFEEMAAKFNTIKVNDYQWVAPSGAGFSDIVSQYHKVNHVKMLIALSAQDPRQNVAFFGGRNIHDGFIFKEAPNLSQYPSLVQYGKDESYAFWQDMEYKITDPAAITDLAGHFMALWEMESKSFFQRSFNLNVPLKTPLSENYFKQKKTLVRHFISMPFKDDQNLEKLYVDMFNAAKKEIRLSTPYFNLTKPLADALYKAAQRGVQVTLITRLDLTGDCIDYVLSDVNKASVNLLKDKISIFEYTVPGEILHSKIVLIDKAFSFVGSVNLNHRSFIHDTENGMMVYGKDFNSKMSSIIDEYLTESRPVHEKQHIHFINGLILGIPMFNDAL